METVQKYILVGWPNIQDFMEHPRWNECVFCDSIPGHEVGVSTYAVHEDLYYEVNNIKPQRFTQEEKKMLEEVSNLISISMYELDEEDEESLKIEEEFNKWINQ